MTLTLGGRERLPGAKACLAASGGVSSPRATFVPEDNIIVGNHPVWTTSGEAYVRGVAGGGLRSATAARGCGRRGRHCDMTGGRVVVLGKTGATSRRG
jgi:glutamate synthase domain-containing protein 3